MKIGKIVPQSKHREKIRMERHHHYQVTSIFCLFQQPRSYNSKKEKQRKCYWENWEKLAMNGNSVRIGMNAQ